MTQYATRVGLRINGCVQLNLDKNAVANIWRKLESATGRNHADTGTSSRVLIYFSGHGASNENWWHAKLGSAVAPEDYDLLGKSVELLSLPQISEVVLVLDACGSANFSDDILSTRLRQADIQLDAKSLVIVSASRGATDDDGSIHGGTFTAEFLKALCNKDVSNKSWAEFGDLIRDEGRGSDLSIECYGQVCQDDPVSLPLDLNSAPTELAEQVEVILDHFHPHIGAGALIGASRLPEMRELEKKVVSPSIVEALENIVSDPILIDKLIDKEGETVDMNGLSQLGVQQGSPFNAISGLSQPIIDTLTITLGQLLWHGLSGPDEREQFGLEGADTSQDLENEQALALLRQHNVELVELERYGGSFRVLLAYCARSDRYNSDRAREVFLFRFLDPKPTADNPSFQPSESAISRATKEGDGIRTVNSLYQGVSNNFKPIFLALESSEVTNIGIAYGLGRKTERLRTMGEFLTHSFAAPQTASLSSSTQELLRVAHGLFGNLSIGRAKWRRLDGDTKFSWSTLLGDGCAKLINSFQDISEKSFAGGRKTNSMRREAAFIGTFLSQIDDRAAIPRKDVIVGLSHGDLHQKNMLVSSGPLKEIAQEDIMLVDFESASDNRPVFEDIAALEVSLSLFFLENPVGMNRLTKIASRIEDEWLLSDLGGLESNASREFSELKAYSEGVFEGFEDYNAYEKVAHATLGALRHLLRSAIFKCYCDFEGKGDIQLSQNVLRSQLRQYYVLLFIRATRLIEVSNAPKSALVHYTYWLAKQLETDPDLMIEAA